jgi:hypothetical protein
MNTFGWKTRLKYAWLAAVIAWIAGWLITLPFELSLARRYADGDARLLHDSLAKGLAVWGGFSLFMAMAGFVPLVLPAFLLIPPRWLVRGRHFPSPWPLSVPFWPSTIAWAFCTFIACTIATHPRAFSSPRLIFSWSPSPWWWCGFM